MRNKLLLPLCTLALIGSHTVAQAARPKALFQEIGKSDREVLKKLNAAYDQLFHGDPKDQAVYYLAPEKAANGKDMAYIYNVGNKTVITEGMSYGMMISVQLNKKTEFDNLWRWADRYMRHKDGPNKGYFAWSCDTKGNKNDPGPASDGEAYFIQALFAASGRWGDAGEINYRAEAQSILDAMLHQSDDGVGEDMFEKNLHMVRFVPTLKFTDPSYHLPAFYTEWAKYARRDKAFWTAAAAASRKFWKTTVNPNTGLNPCYANYDGTPHDDFGADGKSNYGGTFNSDAYRTVMNAALDKMWNNVDPGFDWGGALHRFMKGKTLSVYTVDGKPYYNRDNALEGNHPTGLAGGLVFTNATAAAISTAPDRLDYVRALYTAAVPSGQWRYYDGMLYMLSMLVASGQMKPYGPQNPNGLLGLGHAGK